MPQRLRLISHKLCPYVQRAAIVAFEKKIDFERIDIDLANKPEWFLKISPTGKVPVLEVTEADGRVHILFESAVIAEYLDEIIGDRLLPSEPLQRARTRAWVEYASATLADIARLYSASDFAAFAPVFRYIDVFERELETSLVARGPKVTAWAKEVGIRPSVIGAVPLDYADRLLNFAIAKNSYLARLLRDKVLIAA